MLVSTEIFLDTLKKAKNQEMSIRTIDKSGEVSDQWFKISELKCFRNAYGKTSLALILIPLSDSCVVVTELQHLRGIKLDKPINVQGRVTDEISTPFTEIATH